MLKKETNHNDGDTTKANLLKKVEAKNGISSGSSLIHAFGENEHIMCATEPVGYENPKNMDPKKLVLEASEGFVPLWEKGSILRFRFQERALSVFSKPEEIKGTVRKIFAESVFLWGDAAPVRFTEVNDTWDFEIVVKSSDECNATKSSCVLASAFFPDSGRHELTVYPKMFTQSWDEQVETFAHEVGHIFGLRHWFAKISEKDWPSEIFGDHSPFTIMNYGDKSEFTERDKSDLALLYQSAWSGKLTAINKTPIRFVTPYHTSGRLAQAFSSGTDLLAAEYMAKLFELKSMKN